MANDAMRYRVMKKLIAGMDAEDSIECSLLQDAIRMCDDVLAIEKVDDEFTFIEELEGMIAQQIY